MFSGKWFSGVFFWFFGGVFVLSLIGCSPNTQLQEVFTPEEVEVIKLIVEKEMESKDRAILSLLLAKRHAVKSHSAKLCRVYQVHEPMRQYLINFLKKQAACGKAAQASSNEDTSSSDEAEGLSSDQEDDILTPEGMERIADTIARHDSGSEEAADGTSSPEENKEDLNKEQEAALEEALAQALSEINATPFQVESPQEGEDNSLTTNDVAVAQESEEQAAEDDNSQTTNDDPALVQEQAGESLSEEGNDAQAMEWEPFTPPANDPAESTTLAEEDILEDEEVLAEIQAALDAAAENEEASVPEAASSASDEETAEGLSENLPPVSREPEPVPTPSNGDIGEEQSSTIEEEALPSSEEAENLPSSDFTTSEGLPFSPSSDKTPPPSLQLQLAAVDLMDYAEEIDDNDAEERLKAFLKKN